MALATLSIDVEARLAGLEAGLDKASRIAKQNADKIERSFDGIKSIGAGLAGTLAAAFSVSAISLFVRSTIDGIDALNDLKDATGASIENLSALEDVAVRTGTSFDSVGQALTKFNAVLNEAKPNSEQERVLKAIGLSAQELRKIDPAEALQQVAQALGRYADGGNKARIVQELFGKGVREVAPFLKDLAESGRLNATVTTKQAEEAEKFNKQLAVLSKNSKDAARALLSDLLPALNQVLENIQRSGGLFNTMLANVGLDQFAFQRKALENLNLEIKRTGSLLDEFSDALAKDPNNRAYAERVAQLRAELEGLMKQADAGSTALKALADVMKPAATGRRPPNEGGGKYIPPEAPVIGGAPKADAAKRLYSDPTNEALTRALKAIDSTDINKIRELEASLSELFNLQRETRGDPAVVDAIRRTREEIDKLTLPAGTAILDPKDEQKQSFLRSEKAAYDEIKDEIKGLDEFAQQAGRNIQDALGDTLARTLKGDFDSIGELWGNLIINMIAQASAAQLNKYLFGDIFSGGSNSGAIGSIVSAFLPKFATGTDYVPRDMVAVVHRGERIVTADDNRKGSWGGAMSMVFSPQTYITVQGNADHALMARVLDARDQALRYEFLRRLQRGGVQ